MLTPSGLALGSVEKSVNGSICVEGGGGGGGTMGYVGISVLGGIKFTLLEELNVDCVGSL